MTRRILFLGDSFTCGTGDPRGIGWVGRVAARLAGTPLAFDVVNRGIPGDTSVGIAQRFDHEVRQGLGEPAAGRVVLSFGANDAMGFAGRTVIAHQRTVAVLDDLLRRTATLGLPTLVVGIGAVDDDAHNARSRALEADYAAVCAARAVPFIPVLDALIDGGIWVREAAQGDGAHPREDGYDHLADVVTAGGFDAWLAA